MLNKSGLAYFFQKIKALFFRGSTATVNLPVASWVLSGEYYTQTANVSGVTSSNIIFAKASDSNVEAYTQATNSVGFRSKSAITEIVSVEILIMTRG